MLIRYKQTYLGFAWALLQPILNTAALVFIFAQVAGADYLGAPPVVVVLSGTLIWGFFANAVSESSGSMITARNMVAKVYFPRLSIPLSAVLGGVVDFLVSLLILAVLLVYYQIAPRLEWIYLPLFFLLSLFTATAMGLWLSALNVKYRDVKYIIPFIVRIGILLTPVGAPTILFTSKLGEWYLIYYLNPIVGAIDGLRWCILGETFTPDWAGISVSVITTFFLLATGLIYFRSTEKTFADNI